MSGPGPHFGYKEKLILRATICHDYCAVDCVFPGLTFHHGNRGLHQHQTGARPADGGGRPPIHYYVIHPNDGDDQHNKGNAKLMFGSNYIAWRHYLPLLQFMPVSVPNPPSHLYSQCLLDRCLLTPLINWTQC